LFVPGYLRPPELNVFESIGAASNLTQSVPALSSTPRVAGLSRGVAKLSVDVPAEKTSSLVPLSNSTTLIQSMPTLPVQEKPLVSPVLTIDGVTESPQVATQGPHKKMTGKQRRAAKAASLQAMSTSMPSLSGHLTAVPVQTGAPVALPVAQPLPAPVQAQSAPVTPLVSAVLNVAGLRSAAEETSSRHISKKSLNSKQKRTLERQALQSLSQSMPSLPRQMQLSPGLDETDERERQELSQSIVKL
jgi:hypothetical protein